MTRADGPPPMPRWVKILGAVFIVLVLAFLMAHVTGRGMHGLHG
jgi:hypothetical protein